MSAAPTVANNGLENGSAVTSAIGRYSDRQEVADHAEQMPGAHQHQPPGIVRPEHAEPDAAEQRQHGEQPEQVAEEHDLEGVNVGRDDPDHAVLHRDAGRAEGHQQGGLDDRRQGAKTGPEPGA